MNLQGSLEVTDCTITNQFNESINLIMATPLISIYESIEEPFLSGSVKVVDSLELLKKFRMTQQESLTLRFRQGNDRHINTMVFKVYSISDVQPIKDKAKEYTLHFIDPMYFKFQRTTIDRAFRGTLASMLQKVLIEDVKMPGELLHVEETKPANKSLICPKWNVNKFIEHIKKESTPRGEKEEITYDKSMFFYQSLMFDVDATPPEDGPNGIFYFRSFDTMLGSIKDKSFTYYPLITNKEFEEEDGFKEINSPTGKNSQILGYGFKAKGNTVRAQESGLFSAKQYTFDLLRGVFETYDYNLEQLFNKKGHLSPFAPYYLGDDNTFMAEESDKINVDINAQKVEHMSGGSPVENSESNLFYKVNSTNMFSSQDTILDYTKSTTEQPPLGPENRDSGDLERKAILSLLHNHTIDIKIPFRDDLKVGECVEILIPSNQMDDDDKSPVDSGLYLITTMRYNLSSMTDRGTINITLMKEGIDRPIQDVQMSSTEPTDESGSGAS